MTKIGVNLNSIELISALFLPILLSGCSSQYADEVSTMQISSSTCTPCHTKHAKRGYNKPYTIKGIRYTPQPHYEINEIGLASYYGGTDVFHGRPTSTGKIFDKDRISAAHKTAALPCVIWVTNLENGRRIKVEVNDRGPFIDGRVIDVSRKTAQLLGFYQKGTAKVHIETALPETLMLAQGELHDDVIQLAEVSQHNRLDALQNLTNVSQMPLVESTLSVLPVSPEETQSVRLPHKNIEDIILLASKDDASDTIKSASSPKKPQKLSQNQLSLDSLIHQVVQEEEKVSQGAKAMESLASSNQIQKTTQPSQKTKRQSNASIMPPKILSGHQGYYVHAASFESKAQAQTTYKKLQKIFTPAAVRRESVVFGTTKTHRILVGPLRSRQDAKILLQKVTSAGIKSATVIYNG